jgi:iron complex outermembrane receptor protein
MIAEKRGRGYFFVCLTLAALAAPIALHAQQAPSTSTATGQPTQDDEGVVRVKLPVITVTAEKEPQDAQKSPVSVTAVTRATLDASASRTISDAGDYAPNAFFHEFSARKLSNPRFRGIGAGPSNPGVATYIDGVPQLNTNSSSIELADVEQIEFVRGPQSALYGRNTIGGVITVRSLRPSLSEWTGSLIGPFGNFGTGEVRASASGPLISNVVAAGLSFGYSAREGYTKNDVTGHDLDSRSAVFGKGQLLWTPAANWETRFILTGERARDGDYALNDLGALRKAPFHAARDFEGFTHRDLVAPTVLLRRTGGAVDMTATTGFVWWQTDDETDLDYTPLPLFTRQNGEKDLQFTEEVRFASARDAAVPLSSNVALQWQAGLFVFTQTYDQDAVNAFSPFVLSPFIPIAVTQHSPQAALDDRGVGVYGRGTFVLAHRIEATIGLRADHENKRAMLNTFFTPGIVPPTTIEGDAGFTDVSPQLTVAYHVTPSNGMLYATAARGFKAGGFNAASPAGREAYDEERSWNYEAGAKTMWLDQRVSLTSAVFRIKWDDLQVYLPNPAVPGQFFVSNAGGATSTGAEVELNARLLAGCDFFAGLGYTHARFDSGSVSNGVNVGGHKLASTPGYTADFGGQYSVAVTTKASAYARAEIVFRGAYEYDDANTERQDAYSLTTFRAGARGKLLFAEAWIRNAFDTRYIPIAIAFPGLAPSGFLGEMGAPRTFGVRAGVNF